LEEQEDTKTETVIWFVAFRIVVSYRATVPVTNKKFNKGNVTARRSAGRRTH